MCTVLLPPGDNQIADNKYIMKLIAGDGRFLSEPRSPHKEIFLCEKGVTTTDASDRSFSGIPVLIS